MADFLIDINTFSEGLQALVNESDAPIGSARLMNNMMITDRGGISPRPGTSLIGTYNSGGYPCDGFYNYIKSGSSDEMFVKAYNGRIEYFHPTILDWSLLKSGYTASKEFDFQEHLINTDNEDYLYFCNATENYSRWVGATAVTVGALTGAEVTVTVDSTLKSATYESGTSTATSATTVTDSSKTWVASQWVNFYVLITSGAYSGQVRLITSNTTNQLTFSTLGGDPGAGCTYSLRLLKWASSGTLMINGTATAYSAIPSSTTITMTAPGVAIPSGSAVTVTPTEYPGAPRGNRLDVHHTRMIVAGVQTGLSRDGSGTLQGSQSTATVYVSKIKDATDFTFSAPRTAGQGDTITAPYGGGNITDIISQEDFFYVFKKFYIEADKYPTDSTTDVVVSTPLKQGYGSIGRAIKGRDDVFFMTSDNQFTSIGRVQLKDTIPQTTNIGLIIKRILDNYDFSNIRGGEYKQRLFIAGKSNSENAQNDIIIVYNKQNKRFEGVWTLGTNGFAIQNGLLYFAESTGPNIYQMFTGVNDVRGTDSFGVTASWRMNWFHLVPRRTRFRVKPSQFSQMGINSFAAEGYIRDGSVITFSLFRDFSEISSLQFTFGLPADSTFLQGSNLGSFLGDNPLGLEPLGTISDPDGQGDRHFKFIIYFPDIYSNYLSVGIDSSGTNVFYEITRIGVGTSDEPYQDSANIKEI